MWNVDLPHVHHHFSVSIYQKFSYGRCYSYGSVRRHSLAIRTALPCSHSYNNTPQLCCGIECTHHASARLHDQFFIITERSGYSHGTVRITFWLFVWHFVPYGMFRWLFIRHFFVSLYTPPKTPCFGCMVPNGCRMGHR